MGNVYLFIYFFVHPPKYLLSTCTMSYANILVLKDLHSLGKIIHMHSHNYNKILNLVCFIGVSGKESLGRESIVSKAENRKVSVFGKC